MILWLLINNLHLFLWFWLRHRLFRALIFSFFSIWRLLVLDRLLFGISRLFDFDRWLLGISIYLALNFINSFLWINRLLDLDFIFSFLGISFMLRALSLLLDLHRWVLSDFLRLFINLFGIRHLFISNLCSVRFLGVGNSFLSDLFWLSWWLVNDLVWRILIFRWCLNAVLFLRRLLNGYLFWRWLLHSALALNNFILSFFIFLLLVWFDWLRLRLLGSRWLLFFLGKELESSLFLLFFLLLFLADAHGSNTLFDDWFIQVALPSGFLLIRFISVNWYSGLAVDLEIINILVIEQLLVYLSFLDLVLFLRRISFAIR